MTTIERNLLRGLCAAFSDSYGPETKLCDVRDSEFELGGYAGQIVSKAGFCAGATAEINNRNWWGLTIQEFIAEVLETKTGYICRDCMGAALSFTGSGRSLQVNDDLADVFSTVEEANNALKRAEERGGGVESL